MPVGAGVGPPKAARRCSSSATASSADFFFGAAATAVLVAVAASFGRGFSIIIVRQDCCARFAVSSYEFEFDFEFKCPSSISSFGPILFQSFDCFDCFDCSIAAPFQHNDLPMIAMTMPTTPCDDGTAYAYVYAYAVVEVSIVNRSKRNEQQRLLMTWFSLWCSV
jgi:hypothetical protein